MRVGVARLDEVDRCAGANDDEEADDFGAGGQGDEGQHAGDTYRHGDAQPAGV